MPTVLNSRAIGSGERFNPIAIPNQYPDRHVIHDRRPGYERTDLTIWHGSYKRPGVISVRHEAGRRDFFADGQNAYLARMQRIQRLGELGLWPALSVIGFAIEEMRNEDGGITTHTLSVASYAALQERSTRLTEARRLPGKARFAIYADNDGHLRPYDYTMSAYKKEIPIGVSQDPFFTMHDTVDHGPARLALGHEFDDRLSYIAGTILDDAPATGGETAAMGEFAGNLDIVSQTQDVLDLYAGDERQIEGWQTLLRVDRQTVVDMTARSLANLATYGAVNGYAAAA